MYGGTTLSPIPPTPPQPFAIIDSDSSSFPNNNQIQHFRIQSERRNTNSRAPRFAPQTIIPNNDNTHLSIFKFGNWHDTQTWPRSQRDPVPASSCIPSLYSCSATLLKLYRISSLAMWQHNYSTLMSRVRLYTMNFDKGERKRIPSSQRPNSRMSAIRREIGVGGGR